MPRSPRDRRQGLHHIAVGATSDEAYFRDEADRAVWIRRFAHTLDRFSWGCLSLCELTTHVHALVEIPDESISQGMHYLNSFYGHYFNEKNERRGALIRQRFWSKLVVDDEQLLAAFRYIALNPVRAGLCRRAEDWQWSSFATSCGLTSAFSFIDSSLILGTLRITEVEALHTLRALVRDAR
jgi:REP element-mobilizing transposase RayT